MSVLTDTAPKRIWLCVSDDEDDYDLPYPELYAEDAEITWSTDQPVAVTIEYVREDLSEIAKLREERDALRHDIERHVAICAKQATEIEALRALLNEAQGFVVPDTAWDYTTDAGGYLYDRIDAALASKPNE